MRHFINHLRNAIQGDDAKSENILWIIGDAMGFTVFIIGSVCCLGHLTDSPNLYEGWLRSSSHMAFSTGFCFMLTGLVLLMIDRRKP